MSRKDSDDRALMLMKDVYPLSQHNDFFVYPLGYNSEIDALYLEVEPRQPSQWADVAYKFSQQEGMKYDRDTAVYHIDGQPRVSYSGTVWVRYVGDFEDGSRVALCIRSCQPSHSEAEEQLGRFYGIFKEKEALEPIDVFRKYL